MIIRLVAAIAAASLATAAAAQTPEPEPTYTWTQVTETDAHYLTYAVPETDDISVSMRCARRGARDIRLIIYNAYTGDGAEPRRAEIVSGRARQRLSGRLNADQETSGFETRVPLNSAVMAAFARTGDFAADVSNYEVDARAPAGPQREAVARFLRLCQGRG